MSSAILLRIHDFSGGDVFSAFFVCVEVDMDALALILLLLEAGLALLLLYSDGMLKKPSHVLVCAGLVALAFAVRALFFGYETLDYQDFLSRWVQHFRDNGGFASLSGSVGNYNVPYLYFLALFSYLGTDDLYLIKLLSTLFDVLLAFGAMRLAGLFTRSRVRLLFVYFAVLFWPTVALNSAVWGQCDSIYVSLALLALYWGMSGKPALGMAAMACSFAFKLQAVFIMPVFVLLLIAKRVKLWHFLIFPAVYMLLMLPAILAGRPVLDTITLYFDQMGSVGSALNYNSPSIFAFARDVSDEALAAKLGTAAAFTLMFAVFAWFWWRRSSITNWALLGGALILVVGIPFLLPHMHDRYFYAADILSLAFAVAAPAYFFLPLLCEFASLLGYHAYLKMRYLLLMHWGAAALAFVLIVALVFTAAQLHPVRRQKYS